MTKKLLTVACLVALSVAPAMAGARFTQDRTATLYAKNSLFSRTATFTKLGPDSWRLVTTGSNVTSGERLQQLAMLAAADFALKKGARYFSLEITDKRLSCRSMFYAGTHLFPAIIATVKLSNAAGCNGMEAAQYRAENASARSLDAPADEKRAVFMDWVAKCGGTAAN